MTKRVKKRRKKGKTAYVGDDAGRSAIEKVRPILLRLARENPGRPRSVTLKHDDWCPLLTSGQVCQCEPEVWMDGERQT